MSEIIVSKATINDLDDFIPFFQHNLRKYFSKEFTPKTLDHFLNKLYSKKAANKTIESKIAYIFVVKDKGKIIGFLWQLNKPSGGVAFNDWMAVDENYQRKGIGSKLLKIWEKESLKNGVHSLRLITEENNIKFYEKNGYKMIGLFPKGNYGIDGYHMYKPIQEPKEENYLK